MITLIVEDMVDEQENAKLALSEQGFKVAVAGNLEDALRIFSNLGNKISGIITDLHFPEKFDDNNSEKPCGLAVVSLAVTNRIPVVVCSNINHHQVGYTKSVIDALADHPRYANFASIPIIMDRKNWKRAGENLQELLNKGDDKC